MEIPVYPNLKLVLTDYANTKGDLGWYDLTMWTLSYKDSPKKVIEFYDQKIPNAKIFDMSEYNDEEDQYIKVYKIYPEGIDPKKEENVQINILKNEIFISQEIKKKSAINSS